jgi:putative nucleotidyltransferase with HDIG domain
LGFAIEEQTEQQMLRMSATVRLGSTERLRDELWKMMQSHTPAAAIELLARYGLLTILLPEVEAMQGVEQSAPHVLDVYRHTLAAVTFAAEFRAWLRSAPSAQDTSSAGRHAAKAWHAALDPWRSPLQQHFLQPITADHLRLDWLVWHALLHDVGKPLTRTIEEGSDGTLRARFLGHDELGAQMTRERLEALRFSRQEVQLAGEVVAAHMRPHHLHASFGNEPISRRACFRFFRGTGGRSLDLLGGIDVVLLALADYQATSMADPPPDWEGYLRHAVQLLTFALHAEGLDQVRRPLVDGHTLMRYFDLKPGPEIGDLLEYLQEAQAAGEIADADEALALAATWMLEKKS